MYVLPGDDKRRLRAISLVTGEAGSGKTTVCRKVAAALFDRQRHG